MYLHYMSSPVPSLKTLAAQVAATAPPNVQLPQDLITYVYNYVNLQIVLTEVSSIWDDLQALKDQIQLVGQQDENAQVPQEVLDAFASAARSLNLRVDSVIASFNGAFEAIDQEADAEWRAYYTQILTADIDTITVLKGQIQGVITTIQYFL